MNRNVLESMWAFSPQLVSMMIIIATLIFITYRLTLFLKRFEEMGVRITKLEVRMDILEQKVDSMMQFLINKFGK